MLADDGLDPEGLESSPFDGEGVPRRRTSLIEGGRLRSYLYDTYTARRDGTSSTGNAARGSYRSPPSVATSNLVVAPAATTSTAAGAAGDGVYVTDVAGLHSGVNPVTGVFSVGASGRAIRGGELGRAAARVHDRRRPGLDARRGQRGRRRRPLGPVRRLGEDAAAADRRDDHRR